MSAYIHDAVRTPRGKARPDGGLAALKPHELVTGLIDAMEARGALAQVDVVLSGYQGGTDIAGAILDAVARVKALNPRASSASCTFSSTSQTCSWE